LNVECSSTPSSPVDSNKQRVTWPKPVACVSRYRYTKRRYRFVFGLLDTIASPLSAFVRRLVPNPPHHEPRSILIVQLDHIGDAVLTTPMLRALHEKFPRAAIDVLASGSNQEIFRGSAHVRNVYVSERNWHARGAGKQSYFVEVLRLGRAMRRMHYDLGIDPRGDFFAILVLWLAGIARRVGWDCGGGGFLLSDVAAWNPLRHEVDARRALLEPLGIQSDYRQPELHPSWAAQYSVREMLATRPEPQPPIAVIHASAGTSAKRWPLEHQAELVERLLSSVACSVILVGDVHDRYLSRRISRRHRQVIDWTGRLSLMQLAALLDEADLFIGGDSGPAHIAAAMGTPSVVLFSGTNRSECWQPVGPRVKVIRHLTPCSPCHRKHCHVPGHPCMAEIRPEAVLEAARTVICHSPRCENDWSMNSPQHEIQTEPAA